MITITYPAQIMTPPTVDALVRIVEDHPGDENVRLHIYDETGVSNCKVMRLNVYVDGSPEFLLAAMGLLDG